MPSQSSEQSRAWQRMLSGRRLDLLDPQAKDIEIEDIAHGLARVARWNGQTRGPHIFSVAQHSILVDDLVCLIDPDLSCEARLTALLHDGPEYVIGDLISPFKTVLGDTYKGIEHRILAAIHQRFGLPTPSPALEALIKRADRAAAYLEATGLAGFERAEADRVFGKPDLSPSFTDVTPVSSEQAEQSFLRRFADLCPDERP